MAEVYRSYAATEEAYAAEAPSAHIRTIHLSSARKWIGLAEQSERFTKPS